MVIVFGGFMKCKDCFLKRYKEFGEWYCGAGIIPYSDEDNDLCCSLNCSDIDFYKKEYESLNKSVRFKDNVRRSDNYYPSDSDNIGYAD